MSAQVQQASMVSGRSLVFMVTVALHVAAISALMAWRISEAIVSKSDEPLRVEWLKQEKKPVDVVKPFSDAATLKKIQVVTPLGPPRPIEIDEPVLQVERIPAEPTGGTDPASIEPVPAVETPLRFRAVRPSDDYYPPMAIRLEQQGIVIVRACVDAAGRQTGRPRVVSGSPHRLLDEAAVNWAAEALRFTPATRDGAAIAACKDFKVNFRLH
jgi:TonB family protein